MFIVACFRGWIRALCLSAIALMVFTACADPGFVQRVDSAPQIRSNRSYTVQDLVSGKAEILWVIDNSISMGPYQNELMRNMDIFIRSFTQTATGADWRMGLISTDQSEPPYIGFMPSDRLDHTSPDPVGQFSSAIRRLGVNGSITEKAFRPIDIALTNYPDFLRDASELFIVIVSDEDEQSSISVQGFINWLHTIRPPGSISTYGIFEMQESGCGSTQFQGKRYGELMRLTNGLTFPICSRDYGNGLAAFGADIAQKIVIPKIYLEVAPIVETIQVLYEGTMVKDGSAEDGGYWMYNTEDNAIFFHDLSFLSGSDTATENVQVLFEQVPPPPIEN